MDDRGAAALRRAPFIVLPLLGVADANKTASAYYSPIMFLFIGGAFLALSIERTGLHRRLALAILKRAGDTSWRLLLAVMMATALLSTINSNTSTALIMMPMGLAMIAAGQDRAWRHQGIAGALPMGIAFAATLGGYGTMVGTPTNAIGAGLIEYPERQDQLRRMEPLRHASRPHRRAAGHLDHRPRPPSAGRPLRPARRPPRIAGATEWSNPNGGWCPS